MLRQGNLNKTVAIYRAVTKNSFDAYMWQIVEAKARFIAQIRGGAASARVVEDIEGIVLSYAEVKALSSGNPLVMEKYKVDLECERLQRLRSQHETEQWRLKREVPALEGRIDRYTKTLQDYETDIAARRIPDPFCIELEDEVYSDRKAAGNALLRMAEARNGSEAYERIGSYAGFDLYMQTYAFGMSSGTNIIARGATEHRGKVAESDIGAVASLEYAVRTMEERRNSYAKELRETKKRLEGLSKEVDQPFLQEEELRQLLIRQAEINKELEVDKRDSVEESAEGPQNEEEETSVVMKYAA